MHTYQSSSTATVPPVASPSGMLVAICIGAFLSHYTASVVHISLPYLAEALQSDSASVSWITTGYLLAITSLLPVMGKLGERWGYRRIHNYGFVLFTIGSLLTAMASGILPLLGFRLLQAVGAAMFQATNIALVTIHLPPQRRGRALGMVSTAVALGAMCGPAIGGMIAEWLHWRWLFLLHVPVALLGIWLAFRHIPQQEPQSGQAASNPVGVLLLIISTASGVYGLSQAGAQGWLALESIGPLSVSLAALLLLVGWEHYQHRPFLPIQALRIPQVGAGLIVSVASFAIANHGLVTLPFYLSGIGSLTPSLAGGVLAFYPLWLAITGPLAGYGSDTLGPGSLVSLGLAAMGGGSALFFLYLGDLPIWGICFVLALIGLGMGLVASPNNSFIMRHTPQEHVGAISGMIALTRNLGMALGAALGLGSIDVQAGPLMSRSIQEAFGTSIYMAAAALILWSFRLYRGNGPSSRSRIAKHAQRHAYSREEKSP
ncbi:MFS transporter [Paenibacillus sanguinis]|uniref:MFS transporter n=1 Tax=Paenibacillus sanguinis TaxID=225906 RepID=UPI00037C8390|nr:MFS transporter [Paenibacillus sanguinis]